MYQGTHRYDKHCLSLSKAEIEENLQKKTPFVIRQNMPTTGVSEFEDLVFGTIRIENKELEDHVLIKSDGMPTYNFANVVDDHLMEITHVIRGNEYLSSTPKYNLLYEAFGWEIPQYMHLTPIMKDETRKLSKRHGDANFDDFIDKGYLPEAIINYIALLGWSPKGTEEKFSMSELIERFNVSGLSKSSSIFDEAKMKWLNGEYIKELSFDSFMEKATPYFDQSVIKGQYSYEKFAKLLQSRIEIFSQIPEKVAFMAAFHPIDPNRYFHKKMKLDPEKAKLILVETLPNFEQLQSWNEESLHEVIVSTANALDMKSGAVYTALRIALTATDVTPGGSVEIADILGKEETIQRLKTSLNWLS
jgi:glutamyl-tRNA synthetase